MPTSFVRLIVAGLTLVLAVLTGLVTGFVAGGPGCDDVAPAPASNVSTAPTTAPSDGPGGPAGPAEAPTAEGASPDEPGGQGGPNNDVSPQPDNTNEGTLPGINEAFTLTDDGDCSGFSVLTAVVGFLGALFTGAIVGGVALFVPRTDGETAAGRPVSGVPGAPGSGAGVGIGQPLSSVHSVGSATGAHAVLTDVQAPETGRVTRERKTLVETCIYVRDRATSKAIADRLAWALNEVGVVEDRPAGEPFDTARHEAGGTTPTNDRSLSGTIAAVEISGYTDRGQVVRAPVVTVYQADVR
ncbi:nucleotide exchange factor GrpE [Cryptosporangium aurantiacum]|uniref:GrpE protein n=1 Tax=Cryptosporangium aurantiacum TaxID=134849 RepID=A0A1M7RIB0_9ACTN|nr:nucleotide exchange factor GrpE [Cryptosporangium aurantiacum]SHN46004.1 GrpE protein [Cryptosporangium aurantiacum]